MGTISAIAGSTLLEAMRTRLAWLFVLVALGSVGTAGFVGALALTETRQLQAALLAGALRLALVLIVAAFAVLSMVREADERMRDMLLALPMPRHRYLAGKLAGLCAVAALGAAVLTLPLLLVAPADQCLLWGATLVCEAAIVAAFALFCANGLGQATASLAATLAFYVLSRVMGSIVLLASQGNATGGTGERLAGTVAQCVSWLLPRLDGFARTEWLVYATGTAADLLLCLGQTAIYVALLLAAAAFDLARKEIE